MAKINFGGVMEDVVTREEFPLEKAREVLKMSHWRYWLRRSGPRQALNMRPNGFQGHHWPAPRREEILGRRPSADGWIPRQDSLPHRRGREKATIIQYLISDAGQKVVRGPP